MNPLEDFAQPGSPAAETKETAGLGPLDRITVYITGTRGGGPGERAVEMMDATFDANGAALDKDGNINPQAVPLDVSNIGSSVVLPDFPQAEYAAAKEAGDICLAKSIITAFQQATAEQQSNGASLEENIIDAVLNHAYTYLGFQASDEDPERFIVTKSDVVLTKDPIGAPDGSEGWLYSVRLSSRFGG